jgi:hypothetical protein
MFLLSWLHHGPQFSYLCVLALKHYTLLSSKHSARKIAVIDIFPPDHAQYLIPQLMRVMCLILKTTESSPSTGCSGEQCASLHTVIGLMSSSWLASAAFISALSFSMRTIAASESAKGVITACGISDVPTFSCCPILA